MTTIAWAVAAAVWSATMLTVTPSTDTPNAGDDRSAAAELMLAPESQLRVEGTSTVRGFSCEAKEINGAIQADPEASSVDIARLGTIVRGVAVEIPVGSLDCGNGTMNDHMRKALQAKDHPTIVFRVVSHKVTVAEDGKAAVDMEGDLTIAGTTKRINVSATAASGAGGVIQVTGSKELNMKEYGVNPPKLMMGAMKVNENVVIHFDMALRQR